ncbi:MAG TPA: tyrosine-protein phosphatase [Devosiaceae bacterium]|jgi:protein-tyrosine phosphatase
MTMSFERHIPLAGTYNIRDLGGYALASGGETQWRRMLRADGLHEMTPASMDALVKMGVRTIIDLRGDHETVPDPNPFAEHDGVRYHNIALFDEMAPIAVDDDGFDMGARYARALDRCGPRIAQVVRTIAKAGDGSVLFHCTAGKDRTGVVSALVLTAAGVPRETVVADYALTAEIARGLLQKLRERAIARGAAPERVDRVLASDAKTMEAMLDHLEGRHEGLAAYFTAIGVSEETLATLRQRLTA